MRDAVLAELRWWTASRASAVRRSRMSSCYLVPLLLALACAGVQTLVPLGTALIVIGCVTSVAFCLRGQTPARMAAWSVVGHLLVHLPFYLSPSSLPRAPPLLPSAAAVAGVLVAYRCASWPYSVPPLHFALLAAAGLAVHARV